MKPTNPRHVRKRWLRNKLDGTIYEWNEVLAENAKCEEIDDCMLFPDAYVRVASQAPQPVEFAEAPKKKGGRPKKDLGLEEMVESQTPPPFSNEDFNVEVGKGWPK
jgi:hypothetical protein